MCTFLSKKKHKEVFGSDMKVLFFLRSLFPKSYNTKFTKMGESRFDREEHFTKKVRAGKRTYYFDVKTTTKDDYFITITESKKLYDDGGFVKHKIFLYKEDFNKFSEAFAETVNFVKSKQMPAYDFEEYSHPSSDTAEG